MLKGIPQARRNNAWHKKNTKRQAHIRMSHASKVIERGIRLRKLAEEKAAKERIVKVGFFARLKFFWLMAKIRTKARLRRLKTMFSKPITTAA